jgi:hypothetical protein
VEAPTELTPLHRANVSHWLFKLRTETGLVPQKFISFS